MPPCIICQSCGWKEKEANNTRGITFYLLSSTYIPIHPDCQNMFAFSHKLCRSASRLVSRRLPRQTNVANYGRRKMTDGKPLKNPSAPNNPGNDTPVKGILAGAAALIAYSSFSIVPAGNVGVVDLFGIVDDEVRKPGFTLKNPLASIKRFSTKTKLMDFTCRVPSKEGLSVTLNISLQYRVDPQKAAELYKKVGVNFEEVIIAPAMRSAVRNETSARDAKALYTSEREQIRSDLLDSLKEGLKERGIIVEDVPLRNITLPEKLMSAIERKLEMEQESERMNFVLLKEKQEAQRKAIEAKGIADFQQIVKAGLDDRYLRWKGIEATVEISESTNAKIVVIGSGKSGLPLILGGER